MSLEDPIAGKRIFDDQYVLVSIFIAYLNLQLLKDSEKAMVNPQYIRQYHREDIEVLINEIRPGVCSGISAFLGHMLMRGKFEEALANIKKLLVFKKIGFNKDGTFKDNGEFLISQGKKPGVPEGEELNRKHNPMVALLEDILSNIRWLHGKHRIPFRDIWDEYELAPEENKKLISILSAASINDKELVAFCRETFQMEEALLKPGILDEEKMKKLKSIFQKFGEKAALRYLDQILNGELEKFVREEKGIKTTARQREWDKLVNFVIGEETPKLQHNFSIDFFFKKEEVEKIIKQVVSSLESTKIIQLVIASRHAVLLYKEGENYYFSDPDDGRLLGPFTKGSSNEITSLVLGAFPKNTTNFDLEIHVFGDPISSKLDKPLDTVKLISEFLKERISRASDDNSLSSILYAAVMYDQVNIVQELLKNKVNITAEDSEGNTAWHVAARRGHFQVVQELLKSEAGKATIAATNIDQHNALHLAAMGGHFKVVQELLKSEAGKAIIETRGQRKRTALHLAAEGGHLDIVQELLKNKADITAADSDRQTALHLAAENGHFKIVQELLKSEAGKTIAAVTDYDGYTPLHLAAQDGHFKVVQELLKSEAGKASIETPGQREFTALHLAAQKGHFKVVQELLKNKADIAAITLKRETALHLAAENGHLDVVRELLKNDADINLKNRDGETALQLAKDFRRSGVVQIMESYLQQQPLILSQRKLSEKQAPEKSPPEIEQDASKKPKPPS